tara:strand:+ start:245 stop:643 length:399 start_codon:yes stop_codon:yes gene_type:complete
MKTNKLIKRFSLLSIGFFCLTATHVAAENFVEVKNKNKMYAVVEINKLEKSECLPKGESIKFNLDEIGIKLGSTYSLRFDLSYDCDELKKGNLFNNCAKRKGGEAVKGNFTRTTSTGTKKFVVKSNEHCVLQ